MGVRRIYTLPTIWSESDLDTLRFEQSADVLVIACPRFFPRKLVRYGHADWRLDRAPIGDNIDGPTGLSVEAVDIQDSSTEGYIGIIRRYVVTAELEANGRETKRTNVIAALNDLELKGNYNRLTWTPMTGVIRYHIYEERDGAFGWLGSSTSSGFSDYNIAADYSRGPPSPRNPFVNAENPAAVTFHESRLWLGRTPKRPNAVFSSKIDDIYNFEKSSPIQATDAIDLGIRARRVMAIQHLVSLGGLLALTSDGIVSVLPSQDGYLSPLSAKANVEGYQGVGNARPETVVDVLFYATARGAAVRTLGYTFEKDGYRGNDITVFAPHFFSGYEIQAFAWCEHPSSVLWALRSDGKLLALTWQAEQDVWGWTLCETDGVVESICAVGEGGYDTLYAVVRRTVGGQQKRYVERMAYPYWIDQNWTDIDQAVILDSALRYTGQPKEQFRGLAHLEGRTVSAVADGFVVEGLVVQPGGYVTLEAPASNVVIGLPYEAVLRTLPIVLQAQGGSTKGARIQITDAEVEVMNSRGVEVGAGVESPDIYEARPPEGKDTGANPDDLYSGPYEVSIPPHDWRDARVVVRQRHPLPLVVMGVTPKVEISR